VDFISFVIDSYPAAIGMMLLVSNGVIGTWRNVALYFLLLARGKRVYVFLLKRQIAIFCHSFHFYEILTEKSAKRSLLQLGISS